MPNWGALQVGVAFASGLLLLLALLGGAYAFLRKGAVEQRDQFRQDAIDSMRAAAEAEDRLCEARLAERDDYIGHLEHHHSTTHRRCVSGPPRRF